MNPQGDIVGGTFGTPACGFLLSHGTVTTINVPGFSCALPYGINSVGDIVGLYFDNSGNTHGFLLKKM
jgi:hypothetical protein